MIQISFTLKISNIFGVGYLKITEDKVSSADIKSNAKVVFQS